MSVLNVWKKLLGVLKQNEGYYLLSSLTAVPAILVMLNPSNGYGWGLFVLILLRVLLFRNHSLLLQTLLILILSISATWMHSVGNVSQLEGSERQGTVWLDPNHLKVDGDLLRGKGRIKLGKRDGEDVSILYRLQSPEEKQQWESLTSPVEAQVTLQLQEPEPARNLYQFDYHDYLYFQGIHWVANIQTMEGVAVVKDARMIVPRLRLLFLKKLQDELPPGRMTSYLLAMLFNEVEEVEEEVMDDYRKVGIIHLFSISGLHIQFLLQALRLLFLRLRLCRETIQPLLLASILFYGLLTGGGIGIFRALFTAILLLAAGMLGQELQPKDAFAITITVSLLWNPYLLFSIAFQLSYVLSAVLYFLEPRLKAMPIPVLLQESVLSAVMTAASFPFLSYHFFEIAWIGMFVNILFSYFFTSWFLPLFWLAAVLAFLPGGGVGLETLARLCGTVLGWLEEGTAYLAEGRQLASITGRQATVWYVFLGIVLLVFLRALERSAPMGKPILLLVSAFMAFHFLPLLQPQGKVAFLDVGQGDAILLIAPHHATAVLIDTGGKASMEKKEWEQRAGPTSLEKELVSTLKGEAVRRLDAVVLTHSDTDHMGSLRYLAEELAIERLYYAEGAPADAQTQAVFQSVTDKGAVAQPILAPTLIREGSILLEAIWPENPGKGENRDSVVLFASMGGLRWLFTGDMEAAEEEVLARQYPQLSADVLKVGHHGSATSTSLSFLQKLSPSVAVISVGPHNRYGHPTPQVLERLGAQRMQVFRTDRQGAVHYTYRKKTGEWFYMLQ